MQRNALCSSVCTCITSSVEKERCYVHVHIMWNILTVHGTEQLSLLTNVADCYIMRCLHCSWPCVSVIKRLHDMVSDELACQLL